MSSFFDMEIDSFGEILFFPFYAISVGMIAMLVMFAVILVVIGVIIFLFNAIPYSILFKKVGIPAWHAFIPILFDISRAKMLYNNGAYGLLSYIPFASFYFIFKAEYDTARVFGRSIRYAIFCGLFSPFLNIGMTGSKYQYLGYTELSRYW